jgi:secreted trypsin-like serine protease
VKRGLTSLGFLVLIATQGFASNWAPWVNGGDRVSENNPIARSTVMLETDAQYCSATIIASDTLLTAAHCLAEKDDWVMIHFRGLDSEPNRQASGFVRHENYKDLYGSDSFNDVALVFFKGGLPEGFQATSVLPEKLVLKKDDGLSLAGYGGGSPLGSLSKVDLTITDFLNQGSLIKFEQTKDHGICHGDSGGPAYLEIEGHLYVAGIAAYAYEVDCSGYSVYTKTTPYLDWIKLHQEKSNN